MLVSAPLTTEISMVLLRFIIFKRLMVLGTEGNVFFFNEILCLSIRPNVGI